MNPTTSEPRFNSVIAASAVIVLLAGLLGARILARTASAPYTELTPPTATVPKPIPLPDGGLEVPCWGCQEAKEWRVEFQTDLDLLAPLGDGPANAGDWFKDFTKGEGPAGGPGWMQDTGPNSKSGPRYQEAVTAMKSRIDGPEWLGKVLPPDHPLLMEAEPWCDQATMKFYPDIFALDGYSTRIPNLLFPLNLARSWVARGIQSEDPEEALADIRRAIRLGRLLRQDNVTIIADLVGLACIRIGSEGLYRHAVAHDDFELALTAAIVLGEHSAQRLMTMERVTRGGVADYVFPGDDGTPVLALTDERLENGVITMANSETERRFLGEVVLSLAIVRILGTPEQQSRAVEVLEEMAISEDWVTSEGARWALDFEPTEQFMKEIVHPPS
jgi:hypothetical protein